MPKETDIHRFPSLADAVKAAYIQGQEDERLEPIIVVKNGRSQGRFRSGDSIIFYDIRGEREVELSSAFVDPGFKEFAVMEGLELNLTTMIEYDKNLRAVVAFPPTGEIKDTLSHVLSINGMRLAKIVESE